VAKNAAKKNKKISRGRLPVKTSINLAGLGEKPIRASIAVPAILLIVLAAVMFSKVAVVDRLLAVSRAENEVRAMQRQVDDGYKRIAEYGELTDTYAHYTYSGMTTEELQRADRVEVAKMIDRVILPQLNMSAWSITGNQLTLTVTGETLEEINKVVEHLKQEDIVDFCKVTTATTNETAVSADELPVSTVTARITVYLIDVLEGNAG